MREQTRYEGLAAGPLQVRSCWSPPPDDPPATQPQAESFVPRFAVESPVLSLPFAGRRGGSLFTLSQPASAAPSAVISDPASGVSELDNMERPVPRGRTIEVLATSTQVAEPLGFTAG